MNSINCNTHVYCTECEYGEKLIKAIINNKKEPKECVGCMPLNPEDSFPFEERPNYKKKSS